MNFKHLKNNVCYLYPLLCWGVVWLRACACCHDHEEFTSAAALLCRDDTSLVVITTSGS